MKINYDKIADAIYLRFKDGDIKKTVKVENRLIADIDAEGNVLGVEFLDASNQLKNNNSKSLEESVLEGVPIEITQGTPRLAS